MFIYFSLNQYHLKFKLSIYITLKKIKTSTNLPFTLESSSLFLSLAIDLYIYETLLEKYDPLIP